jgi:hypothetical protein
MTGWRNREPKHVPLPIRASPNTGGSFTRAEIAVTSILLFITALGSSFSAFFTLPAKRRIALNLAHTVTTVHSLVASSSPGALLHSQNTFVNTTAILTHHDCCGSAFCAVLRRRTLLCELLRQAVDRCPTAPFEPLAAARRCWGACSPCS